MEKSSGPRPSSFRGLLHEGCAQELAETRFALARALWDSHKDTTRARQLAKQAESALAQPGSEELHGRVRVWLAPRTPRG
ncbi:hypothetical protein F0U61_26590 [Archangium violaceum]|uniref:hypothetical protein n=1 Tax=Archangium violaceum TaxID=83451 RepID=UPI002B306F48|nr:hypothetical protein F0U61_26590 [Archangium violaceum]